MLNVVRVILDYLFPSPVEKTHEDPKDWFAGHERHRQHWFRKKGVLWFNGFPGWPKLPLVQRRRASPSSLNPVASSQPEEEDGEELDDDPEPLL